MRKKKKRIDGKDATLYLNDGEYTTFPICLKGFKVGIAGVTRQPADSLKGAFDNFSVSSPKITRFAVKPSGKLVSTWADIKYGYYLVNNSAYDNLLSVTMQH